MDNEISPTPANRDANGRFLPGRSGNPSGKRPGTRNRATLIRAALDADDEMAVARSVIDKAKSGDGVAARFLLGLLCPRPRGRAITLDLPEGARAGDTVAAFNATLLAMANGEITPDEALTVTRVLDGRLQSLNAFKLQRELTHYHGDFIRGDELFLAEEDRFREPGEVDEAADEAGEDEADGDEAGEDEEDEMAVAADTQTEPSPACSQRGFATPAATAGTCGPRESGRGQGEGSRDTCDRDDSDASDSAHPNPPELLSKGPQALGEASLRLTRQREPPVPARAGEGIAPSEPGPIPPASESSAEHLHSACIEQAQEAERVAFLAAQRKLAQWSHVLA